MKAAAIIVALFAISVPVLAREHLTPEQQKLIIRLRALNNSLHPQRGNISVPEAHATLHLGDGYYFLGSADAKRVITEAWGNPSTAADDALGMIFPSNGHFYDQSWGAVITFKNVGYVASVDTDQSDYERVAKQIQEEEPKANAEREKLGAPPIHFVGWAQPPSFDKIGHTAVWARDLRFGDEKSDTLNYDVRILNRSGILSINIIAPMTQLPSIKSAAEAIRLTATFSPGNNYDDFKAGLDKKASYGVAGMVAAGAGVVLAQKLGLFALLAVFAKKILAIIVVVSIALLSRIKRLFRRSRDTAPKR